MYRHDLSAIDVIIIVSFHVVFNIFKWIISVTYTLLVERLSYPNIASCSAFENVSTLVSEKITDF